MKQAIIGAIVGALLLVAGIIAGQNLTPAPAQTLGGSIDVPGYYTISPAGTSTTKTVTNATTIVAATSTGITYLAISNGGAPISCQADNGKPAVFGSGINIASSSIYVFNFNEDNLYRGTLQCISGGGSSIVGVYSK